MKRSIHIGTALTAVALSAAMTACSNETIPGQSTNQKVLYANIKADTPDSRTAVDLTEYAGGAVGILWTPADEVGVFSASTRNARFVNSLSAPAGRTPFAGELDGDPAYAYYPWSADNDGCEPTALRGILPAEQTYDATTGALDGDYKYGIVRAGADDEFDFVNLFALLRFRVDATGTDIVGERLKSVTLELPAGRVLAGDFTFSAVDGTYRFTGSQSNSVTVGWTDRPALESGKGISAYMTCAPDMKADDRITVTVTTDRHTATFTRTIAYDFEPATVYTFDFTLSKFDDLTVEELPVEETANCYMITTTGEHDFCATQIGNGPKGIIPGAGFHTEDPYINPVSAKLLWQDTEGFVSDIRLVDGRVHYKANTNVGNALIAVYDAEGKVLWSWHIWGVGDELPGEYELHNKQGSSEIIMDRDLGAFPATDAERLSTTRDEATEARVLRAMLYQWGRKDPFPNALNCYAADGAVIDNVADKWGYSADSPATAEEATLAYAVGHPDRFIDLYRVAGKSDWLYDHNDLLWGDDRFSGGDNYKGQWTNVKTIYDPSPVGYRVADYFTYRKFIPVDVTIKQLKGVMGMTIPSDGSPQYPDLQDNIYCVIATFMNGNATRYIPKGVTENRIGMSRDNKKQHGYGIYLKRHDADTEGNFFGQTGFLQGGATLADYGISSYRWMSCGAVTNTIDCGSFYLGQFAWRTAQSDYTDSDHNKGLPQGAAGVVGTIKTANSLQPRYACPVRCVREKK